MYHKVSLFFHRNKERGNKKGRVCIIKYLSLWLASPSISQSVNWNCLCCILPKPHLFPWPNLVKPCLCFNTWLNFSTFTWIHHIYLRMLKFNQRIDTQVEYRNNECIPNITHILLLVGTWHFQSFIKLVSIWGYEVYKYLSKSSSTWLLILGTTCSKAKGF